MKSGTRVIGLSVAVLAAAVVAISCGGDRDIAQIAGPGEQQAGFPGVAKLVSHAGAAGEILVAATVTREGEAVEGAVLTLARSVSGRTPVYSWSGTTGSDGTVEIRIASDGSMALSGYYLARATDSASGEVIGQWGSIPLNADKRVELSLPLQGHTEIGSQVLHPKGLDRVVFEELWNRNRPNLIGRLFAADFELHVPGSPDFVGHEGMAIFESIYRTAFPDIHFAIEDQVAEGDMVVSRWFSTGTHLGELLGIPATGNRGSGTVGITIRRVVDGKSVEEWALWNMLGLLQQVDVLPTTGTEHYTWGKLSSVTGVPGDPESNKASVRRYTDQAWNSGNLTVIDEIYSEDYILHDPTQPGVRGTEGLRQVVQAYHNAFPDVNWAVEDQIAEGGLVATRITSVGTHEGEIMGVPGSGALVTVAVHLISRFADGKIVEEWIAWDTLGMLQQIGAIPPMGG